MCTQSQLKNKVYHGSTQMIWFTKPIYKNDFQVKWFLKTHFQNKNKNKGIFMFHFTICAFRCQYKMEKSYQHELTEPFLIITRHGILCYELTMARNFNTHYWTCFICKNDKISSSRVHGIENEQFCVTFSITWTWFQAIP